MKRSDMLDLIKSLLENRFHFAQKCDALYILNGIEDSGMLPPKINSKKISIYDKQDCFIEGFYGWEKDDDH